MHLRVSTGCLLFALALGCGQQAHEAPATLGVELRQDDTGGTTEAGDAFGAVLATGNFNHDAYDDLVVGAPGEDSNAGAIFIFPGSASGIGSGSSIKQTSSTGGNEAGDRFASALATGDVNNDGFDDLLVGVPGEDSAAGMLAVWLGGLSGLTGNPGLFYANDFGCGSKEAGDEFGAALAIGDFNDDGFKDVAIGAPGENDGAGWVCIVKGRNTGIAGAQGAYYSQATLGLGSEEAGDRFGAALGAGQLYESSQLDLAIGAPGENGGKGTTIVFFGNGAANAGTSADSFFIGGLTLFQDDTGKPGQAGDHFGAAILVKNLNGDDNDELIVGAPDSMYAGQAGGVVSVFKGRSDDKVDGLVYTQTGTVAGAGTETGDRFGAALAAGDINGDGKPELIVGSPGEGPASSPDTSGMIVTFPGSLAGPEPGFYTTQEDLAGVSEAGDLFGSALTTGNFNGDAYADLAVGVPGEAPGSAPAGGYVNVKNGGGFPLTLSVGPILGAATNTSIKIWVRANQAASYQVKYAPTAGGSELTANFGTLAATADYTATLTLSGLIADTQYNYRVLLNNTQFYSGSFRTLPAPSSSGTLVFAYGADTKFRDGPFDAASSIAAGSPRFMILGGDNIYADSSMTVNTKPGYEARYRQTFADPALRALMRQTPMFMMWDDHEIKNDWSGGNLDAPYPDALAAYQEYQGQHNPAPLASGTIYYTFSTRQVGFFVLDTRSYRTAESEPDGPSKTMLGTAQRTALLNWLSSPGLRFKFIVSSVPFSTFATTVADAWKDYRNERDQILAYVSDHQIPGVVILSGDQHWAGVFKIDDVPHYYFYEFMPTPLGVENRRLPDPTNDAEVLYWDNQHRGHGRFTATIPAVATNPASLKFEWVDEGGTPQHTRTITTSDMIH